MSAERIQELVEPAGPPWSAQLWDAGQRRLRGRIVRGLFAAQVREQLDEIERRHRDHGAITLVLDAAVEPASGGYLVDLLEDYFCQVGCQATPSDEMLRLSKVLFEGEGALDPAASRPELLARLWTLLARRVPAALIVLHPDTLDERVAAQLGGFLARIFSNPVVHLAPEVGDEARAGGAVVFVGEPRSLGVDLGALGFEVVDAAAQAPAALRAYLGQAEVIDRLARSTGGSLDRLRALLDELPANVEDLLMHRCAQLDEPARDLLDAVALAERPVPADWVDEDAARTLVDQGFVRRQMDGTRVLLFIDEPDFQSRLAARIDPSRRCALHLELGDAARVAGDRAEAVFHLLHTDRAEDVVDEAVAMAAQMLDRGSVDSARRLAEAAQVEATGDDAVALARLLVRLERAEGNHDRALARLDMLAGLLDGAPPAELQLTRAELLLASGDHPAARQAFSRAADAFGQTGEAQRVLAARHGLAEATYLAGDQDSARGLACELLDSVDETSELGIQVHNLCGKIAIFDADYPKARDHFEKVRQAAEAHQRRADACRADANLGIVVMQTGDTDAAEGYLERAAEASRGLVGVDRGGVLLNLAMLQQRKGCFADALHSYVEALECAGYSGSAAVYYTAAYNLATLYQDMGAYERALTALAHLDREPNGPRPLRIAAWTATSRAGIYFEQGHYRRALATYRQVREEFADVDELALHGAKERLQAALAHLELGEVEQAAQFFEGVTASDDPRVLGLQTLAQARSTELACEPAQAGELAGEACAALSQAGYHHGYCRAAVMRVRLLEADGRFDEAYEVLDEVTRRIHRRAEAVPDVFRDAYFDQPVHRTLLGWTRKLEPAAAEGASPGAGLPSSRVLAIAHEILEGKSSLREQQRKLEHECIRAALERTEGNITRAAELLQLNRSRLSQIINADKELSALKERLKN